MKRWFYRSTNPKDLFPIDQLPKETWGKQTTDAVALFYRKKPKAGWPARPVVLVDQEKETFFRRILPILDGFDNLFHFAQQSEIKPNEVLGNWLQTLETLYRRLLLTLEKEGLIPIPSVGKLLDLSQHEVLDVREVPGVEENVIVEEVVRGYRFGRRIIRDAKVIVAKAAKG